MWAFTVPEWFDNRSLTWTFSPNFLKHLMELFIVLRVTFIVHSESLVWDHWSAACGPDTHFIITTTGGSSAPMDWQPLPPLHRSVIHDPFSTSALKNKTWQAVFFLSSTSFRSEPGATLTFKKISELQPSFGLSDVSVFTSAEGSTQLDSPGSAAACGFIHEQQQRVSIFSLASATSC